MYVYVTRLRERGVKLSKDDAKFAMPARGWLTMQPSLTVRGNAPCVSAWLNETEDTTSTNVIPPMERAWVKRATFFQMVIVGSERIDKGRKDCDWYPQAWWCRFPARVK